MRKRYCKGSECASTLWTTRRQTPGRTALDHTDKFTHSLAEPIFWVAAVICVIAEIAILRSAFIPRSHAADSDPIPHSPRGAEMIWGVIPAIALALLLSATWRAIH